MQRGAGLFEVGPGRTARVLYAQIDAHLVAGARRDGGHQQVEQGLVQVIAQQGNVAAYRGLQGLGVEPDG
ncbi:hypothetical protein D3C76_949530 [compost metagenome]